MSNSNVVIQACSVCDSRDLSRKAVTAGQYTQMVMLAVGRDEETTLPVLPSVRPQRLSSPGAGRPLTTEASTWSEGVLHAQEIILDGLSKVALPASGELIDPGPSGPGAQRMSAIDRAARRLAAAWYTGVVAGRIDVSASLLEAEIWFTGSAAISASLPLDAARHAQRALSGVVSRDGAWDMLPYALDPVPHEYRRDLLRNEFAGAARAERKRRGSFYTPSDVADHVLALALDHVDVHRLHLRLLDPAVGTGVFLRSAFEALIERGMPASQALQALHGIDLDECSVDMAAFVLLADYLRSKDTATDNPTHTIWAEIRARLLASDALLTLKGCPTKATLFGTDTGLLPSWLEQDFDVIVGNPPYARVGPRKDLPSLQSRFSTLQMATPSSDIYPAFVELLCSSLRAEGCGSLIVPMSVGYSSTQQLEQLRTTIRDSGGEWTFEFFDRTPDALFGDDVKQRTAIVTRRASNQYGVNTGPVMRWTSRNRSSLFSRIPHIPLGPEEILHGVPKVGSQVQAEALRSLRATRVVLGERVVSCRRSTPPLEADNGAAVFVAGTAYNWLNVYRTAEAITRGVDHPTASPVTALTAISIDDADVIFALLSSRIGYWLWRVETDVFHVPLGWIKDHPLTPAAFGERRRGELADLGRQLWSSIERHPVKSLNGGTTTLSYCPHAEAQVLDEIDARITAQFGLPDSFGHEVAQFVRDLTTAGRESENEHGLRRALASWREG